MLLADAGLLVSLTPTYHIALPPGDALILVACVAARTPAARFTHPQLAAATARLLHFRHDLPTGGKYWTSQAGVAFYFVVPKTAITLTGVPGYSYVPVTIGGHPFILNVSGGTAALPLSGWCDWIGPTAHLTVTNRIGELYRLAQAAWTPAVAQAHGIRLTVPALTTAETAQYRALIAGQVGRARLGVGARIQVAPGWEGVAQATVTGLQARRQRLVAHDAGGYGWAIPYRALDWPATCALNGWELGPLAALPAAWNRLGPVVGDPPAEEPPPAIPAA